ncbi:hypothetical protein [Turicibacter sanguinis]|uniref:hypothetical protein n=1 Tax=Turicibacter sanguinis TaxID=154288 RepID=UPI001896F05C|nr:hypothetical protein [Turicibacter sanguinis]
MKKKIFKKLGYELLAKLYHVTSQDSEWNADFDLNGDGIIDLYDSIKISTKMNK